MTTGKTLTVVFGTTSASKIRGMQAGFIAAFPDHDIAFTPFAAASGVPGQPIGSDQTLRGALNRLEHTRIQHPQADFVAANESGVIDDGKTMRIINWVAVEQGGHTSTNTTATFEVPPKVAAHVRAGLELDAAFRAEFGERAEKTKIGGIGYMTGEVVSRHDLLFQATVTSLVPFTRPELFEK